jgi:hypothetical protein
MSWFELITTHGRWLRNVEAEFRRGEFKLSWLSLGPDEDVAVLIDRHANVAYLNRPFAECQILASRHQYELFIPGPEPKSMIDRIERVLDQIAPKS